MTNVKTIWTIKNTNGSDLANVELAHDRSNPLTDARKTGIAAMCAYKKGFDLSGANLDNAEFVDADLMRMKMVGTSLVSAKLAFANLTYTDLRRADLRYADLRNAELKGSNLRGANLDDCNLKGTNISGVDFQGVDLRSVDFSYAVLNEYVLSGYCLAQVRRRRGKDVLLFKTTDGEFRVSCGPETSYSLESFGEMITEIGLHGSAISNSEMDFVQAYLLSIAAIWA